MMKKKTFAFILASILVFSGSCSSHHILTGIERSRILIDQRYDATTDKSATAFLTPYKHKVDSMMAPIVARANQYMAPGRPESLLSNLLADVLMVAAQSFNEQPDFSVYNIGGMRSAIAKGDITVGDVLNVAPFENKICFVTLTGSKVLELFEQIAHRGGEAVSSTVKMVITHDGKLKQATINGKKINSKAQYRIATIDYVVQGNDGMKAFIHGTNLVSPQTEKNNLRNIITNYFRQLSAQGKTVTSQLDGRISITPNE